MKTIRWGLVIVALTAALATASPGYAATRTVLNPTDDTFVRVGAPAANFNQDANGISVTTGMGAVSDIGFLRFDLSSISSADTLTATLRLYERTGFGSGVIVGVFSAANDDWNGAAAGNGDETTLTYNNAPSEGSLLASANVPSNPGWIEFSGTALTNYVKTQSPTNGGDGWVTLRLRITNSEGIVQISSFEDRENDGGTGNPPELPLDVALPPTATATPTSTSTSTPTATNTSTNTPTATQTSTPTNTPTPTATNTATATPTATFTSTPLPPGALCVQVYWEMNGNGARDPGEPLVAGAAITVKNSSDAVVGTYTTDAAHEPYCFLGLPPGSYSVVEVNPAGYTSITSDIVAVMVASNVATMVEFGDQPPTPTPTSTSTNTVTATPTATPTSTSTPTVTQTPTRTSTYTPTPTNTPAVTSGTINPTTGGGVTTTDGKFQIQFPAGAITTTVTITHTNLPAPSRPLPTGRTPLRAFALEARTGSGQPVTQFQGWYTIVITYTHAELAAQGIVEANLTVAFWNGNAWVDMLPCAGCGVDPVNDRITIVSNHFTEFAAMGSNQPPTSRFYLPFVGRDDPQGNSPSPGR